MSNVVYGLEDPRDGFYHYIGITDDVYKRFNQHVSGDGGNIQKNGWIFECRQNNVMIIMRELEQVETSLEALEREKYWIRYYLDLGHPLHNMKVVKSILQERARMERLARRTLQERARPDKQPKPDKHLNDAELEQAVLELWCQGKRTHREIASVMRIPASVAYRLLIHLDNAGSISRTKRNTETYVYEPHKSVSQSQYRESLLPHALEAWEQGYKTVRTLAKHIKTTEWHAWKLITEINKLHAASEAV